MYLSTELFNMRFADDTSLIGVGSNKEDTETHINNELQKLYDWFCSNKLTLHPDKSRCIIHTKDKLLNIKLGGKQIMRCGYNLQEEGVKLLGITIDENLDWKLHIKKVKKKISKGNYLLWRYKKLLSPAMKKIIYESFIRCHITYCLTSWGAKKSAEKQDLIKQIKRCWTKIGQRYQHTNERLRQYNIYKLEDELRMQEVKTIWRWEKDKIPKGLAELIIENRTRELRHRTFERKPRWKKDSIAYRLATRSLKEIEEISCARSKKGLMNKYKRIIMQTYDSNCNIRNCYICARTLGRTL